MRYDFEIDRLMKKICTYNYIGTFPSNCMPSLLNEPMPWSFVVNTQQYGSEGEHWLGIVKYSYNNILFIDPLDLYFNHIEPFKSYLNSNAFYVCTIPYAIQSTLSDACGDFCAFILSSLPFYNFNLCTLIVDNFSETDFFNYHYTVTKWFKDHSK